MTSDFGTSDTGTSESGEVNPEGSNWESAQEPHLPEGAGGPADPSFDGVDPTGDSLDPTLGGGDKADPEDIDPEALAESLEDDLDDDFDDEDEDEDGTEDEGDGGGDGDAAEKPAPKKKKDQDPDETLLYTKTKIPKLPAMREAMDWAFEGQEVEPELLDRYANHALLVLEANRTMNLTAIVDPKEVAAKHYLDSWRASSALPLMGRSLLDLGTGPGFPGVPIAMAEPHTRVCLLDSTQKRTDFCQRCVDELGLKNVTVVHDRAEEYLARNRYDVVTARAISSVRENVRLLRKVRHSLQDLVMYKGKSWSREVRAGEREAERLGFRLDTVVEYDLPGEMGHRAILVYRAPGGVGF